MGSGGYDTPSRWDLMRELVTLTLGGDNALPAARRAGLRERGLARVLPRRLVVATRVGVAKLAITALDTDVSTPAT